MYLKTAANDAKDSRGCAFIGVDYGGAYPHRVVCPHLPEGSRTNR